MFKPIECKRTGPGWWDKLHFAIATVDYIGNILLNYKKKKIDNTCLLLHYRILIFKFINFCANRVFTLDFIYINLNAVREQLIIKKKKEKHNRGQVSMNSFFFSSNCLSVIFLYHVINRIWHKNFKISKLIHIQIYENI